MDRVKANIEIYDWWSPREKITLWRLGIILYHAIAGSTDLGPILEGLLAQARTELRRSDRNFWWYSMAVGRSLILASANRRKRIPRFYPATKLVPSDYLWRIFLKEDGRYEMECYRVSFTRRRLDSMTIVDWKKAAKRQ